MPYRQDCTILYGIPIYARIETHQAKDEGRKTNEPGDKRNVAHIEIDEQKRHLAISKYKLNWRAFARSHHLNNSIKNISEIWGTREGYWKQ